MKQLIKRIINNYRWRKIHPYCQMFPVNRFDYHKVEIGNYSYGELNVVDFGGECHLRIGNFVSVAEKVTFILNAEHNVETISTYPFKTKVLKTTTEESFGKGDIVIADDVWIGYGATIMSNISIGQGAIVAAGAIVTKNVPPYAIVGGIPAKVLHYRFSAEKIEQLLQLDYSRLTKEEIEKHISILYSKYSNELDLSWFPKK